MLGSDRRRRLSIGRRVADTDTVVAVQRALDLVVIGGGPAGAAAAITAARHGLDVAVVDKASFPRDKTCGDGLTALALRLLEALGLDVPALGGWQPVTETVIVTPAGRRIALPHPVDGLHAGVVRRTDLDDALLEECRRAGAEVRVEAEVAGIEVDDTDVRGGVRGEVRVALKGAGHLRSRFAIAADGHWSTTRRALTGERAPARGEWHAARQYFSGVSERRLVAVFDRELLPGYAWVFPLPDGGANVGFGVLRAGRHGRDLASLWPRVVASPAIAAALGPDAVMTGPVRAWPIPTHYEPDRLSHRSGRVLYAGDAAGVVDPMTGEGIGQALETGMLAAASVATSRPTATPTHIAAHYRRSVRAALGADLAVARTLQRLLAHGPTTRAALGLVGLSDWTRRNFARWMWEDYPRGLLLTPRRWERGMLTPPGAFRAAA